MHRPHCQNQRQEGQQIHLQRIVQIDPGQFRAHLDHQTIIAAIFVKRLEQIEHHLRERHGDHDEIDPPGAQADRAGDQGKQRRQADRQRQLKQAVGRGRRGKTAIEFVIDRNAHRIGADPDKCRMAETGHSPVTKDQVQADGGYRQNDKAGRQQQIEFIADPVKERRQHAQQQHDANSDPAGSVQGFHQRTFGGNRPCGRKARITAMRI